MKLTKMVQRFRIDKPHKFHLSDLDPADICGFDVDKADSAIEHVMSGVNPQGCEVHAFKPPSAEELDHDFLWSRVAAAARARAHRYLQPLAL